MKGFPPREIDNIYLFYDLSMVYECFETTSSLSLQMLLYKYGDMFLKDLWLCIHLYLYKCCYIHVSEGLMHKVASPSQCRTCDELYDQLL